MILATRTGADMERRTLGQPGVAVPTYSDWLGLGGTVTHRSQTSIPAVSEAIRIASQGVAQLEFGVWRGKGIERREVASTWQARFFSGVPNETDAWFLVWEWTEASLTARNNAFWIKTRNPAGQVESVTFVHPDMIFPVLDAQGEKHYRVTRLNGRTREYAAEDVVHFRGVGSGGLLYAPSPVEVFRDALNAGMGKYRTEALFYERGMGQSLALMLPGNVTREQGREIRAVWEATHGGTENQHKVRVLGGGGTVQTIGVTMSDAQFIEAQQFTVDDVGRMFGVPSTLLGGGVQNRGAGPLTPEHETMRWLRYGLAPRLQRIEQTIYADRDFFGPGARDYPRFNSEEVVRGDLATEASIALSKVQSGQWLVDEARALDGLPPLPDGAGQIPQVVPVGGTPNPDPGKPPASPPNTPEQG